MDKNIQLLTQLMRQDPLRLQALKCLNLLNLSQGYIAAGFVRNMVWDHLHHKSVITPLNDVDVIYFDLNEQDPKKYQHYQENLQKMMPQLKWQVRNQALMHKRNGDQPYKSSLDAMGYWPEKETAVAISQLATGEFDCIAAFGFDSLFNLQISHNPKREQHIFEQRISEKDWFEHWPMLSVVT